jgi:hypothetical protein
MISPQIPGGHGACGHGAASELDVGIGRVANPVRFVRREEIAVKVRSLMRGVARRGVRERIRYQTVQTFKCHESSQPREKKKESQWRYRLRWQLTLEV